MKYMLIVMQLGLISLPLFPMKGPEQQSVVLQSIGMSQINEGVNSHLTKGLNDSYRKLLEHVTNRVNNIENELTAYSQSTGGWFAPVISFWAATKAYARSLEVLAIEPSSEIMAQDLIDTIMVAETLEKDNKEIILKSDSSNEDLLAKLHSKIRSLRAQYGNQEASRIKTQLAYLDEYEQRINKVELKWQEAYSKGYQN